MKLLQGLVSRVFFVHAGLEPQIIQQFKLYEAGSIVNKKAFDALDKASQDALLKAGADAEARGWANSSKVNTDTIAKLKANGMAVEAPPAALKADMAKVGDTMLKEWLDKAGPEGKALIDAYRK